MACAKFQGNQFRFDREINEKHAVQIYRNNCVLDYSDLYMLTKNFTVALIGILPLIKDFYLLSSPANTRH